MLKTFFRENERKKNFEQKNTFLNETIWGSVGNKKVQKIEILEQNVSEHGKHKTR